MVELVDTPDLGSGAERCGGSSPPSRTMTTIGIARARGQAPDEYFFFSRKRSPEMSEPDCSSFSADPVCAHRKELFQPVFRTDYY